MKFARHLAGTEAIGIGPGGWYHLAFFGLFLPYLAVKSARRLPALSQRPRKRHFISVLVVQAVTVVISLAIARLEGIPLWPAQEPPLVAVAAGLILLAGCYLALKGRWREAVVRRDPVVHFVMPRDAIERRLWVAVSFAAGVGEEITYRGVMYVLFWRLTHDPVVAALATAALFGAAHAVQGWRAVGAIALISLGLQGLVLLAGSLYVAMAVHVVYDIAAGLTYGRLGEELGYPVEGMAPVETTGAGTAAGPGG